MDKNLVEIRKFWIHMGRILDEMQRDGYTPITRGCLICDRPLRTSHPRAMYCSGACKQEAHRRRHREA